MGPLVTRIKTVVSNQKRQGLEVYLPSHIIHVKMYTEESESYYENSK